MAPRTIQLSTEGHSCLQQIANAYIRKGMPPWQTWWFDPGDQLHAVNELRAVGLLQLKGTSGGRWFLTNSGHQAVMQIRSERLAREAEPPAIKAARKLFAEVIKIGFDDDLARGDSRPLVVEMEGSTKEEHMGARVLLTFGILKRRLDARGNYLLTERGHQICLRPELLDQALLATQSASDQVVNNMVNNYHGPTQVGDGNVQHNPTYHIVIQQLIENIEKDDSIEPEEKSRWIDTLKDIAASSVGQAIAQGIGTMFG